MAYALPDDIADRLGRELDANESRIVEARLDDIEAMIFDRLPDLPSRMANNPTLGRLLVMVEADVLLRLIRNPLGLIAESEGGYGYRRVTDETVSGRLALLKEEWRLLGVKNDVVVLDVDLRSAFGGVRREGDIDPSRGKSSPANAPFEQGLDTALWG